MKDGQGDVLARHRLDRGQPGLSARSRRVAYAVIEAILADEGEDGVIIPGRAAACTRAVAALDDALGRSSPDLRRGFGVLALLMEWLPLFVIGAFSRASTLPIARRVAYLEGLETSRIGWLSMLFVAFKIPMAVQAFEDPEELRTTGFERPDMVTRRRLPVSRSEGATP